jgi:hypothetical protein
LISPLSTITFDKPAIIGLIACGGEEGLSIAELVGDGAVVAEGNNAGRVTLVAVGGAGRAGGVILIALVQVVSEGACRAEAADEQVHGEAWQEQPADRASGLGRETTSCGPTRKQQPGAATMVKTIKAVVEPYSRG